jgi:hypothetical protein
VKGTGTLLLLVSLTAGCGKEGPPLAPIQRIPSTTPDFSVGRFGDDVFVRFIVPTTNIDGNMPADIARIELYAITTAEPPPPDIDAEKLRAASTLVFSERVQRPLPPIPAPVEGQPPLPPLPVEPGVQQGATVVVKETLSPEARVPVVLPRDGAARKDEDAAEVPVLPIVFKEPVRPLRYYYVVSISPRGRYGPNSRLAPAPLEPTSGAPSVLKLSYDEQSLTIRWTPPPDARGIQPPEIAGVLPSRPMVEGPPRTSYDVFEVPRESVAGNVTPAMPTGITPAPVFEAEVKVANPPLGPERCFVVRPVDILSDLHVRGPASPVECITLDDKFPPAAPRALDTVGAAGVINLIWDPNEEKDLAGYLVLRGEGTGAKLTPVTKEPIRDAVYEDRSVKPGVTYVYAVVAVDRAGNQSVESNRREETAR